jgi:hypothetical protein
MMSLVPVPASEELEAASAPIASSTYSSSSTPCASSCCANATAGRFHQNLQDPAPNHLILYGSFHRPDVARPPKVLSGVHAGGELLIFSPPSVAQKRNVPRSNRKPKFPRLD